MEQQITSCVWIGQGKSVHTIKFKRKWLFYKWTQVFIAMFLNNDCAVILSYLEDRLNYWF